MIIELHPSFKKSYKARIVKNPRLVARTKERIELFSINPQSQVPDGTWQSQVLRDHSLKGVKRNYQAFSVAGDIRIVYYKVSKDRVIFVDVSTHNQVY